MTKRAAVSICVVLLSLATALVGAGCGASNPFDPVATAATTSNSSPGYRMTFVMRMTSSALPQPIVATGNGVVDTHDRAMQMGLDMSVPELAKVMPSSGGTLHLDMVLRDMTLYMRMPAVLTSKLPGGRPWIKLDLAKLASAMGVPGLSSMFGGPGMDDPSQFLQYLRGVSGGVTKVGSDSVAGVQTTHYRANIDLAKAIDRLSGTNAAAARRLGEMLKSVLSGKSVPVDVWIDSRHYVRRMSFHMNMSMPMGQSMAMSMQLTIPQYGPQAEPQAPPASQVTDLSSLMHMNSTPPAGA
jgi:hypothetical protein